VTEPLGDRQGQMTIGRGGPGMHLVDERGVVDTNGGRWLRSASIEERGVLARAVGPVLDVGCGPGRHVKALQCLGVEALGIDMTPSVLETAARWGAAVFEGSVFDPLPRMGQWQTALLLDGNSGLGGDPLGLLLRLRSVLRVDGRVLADLVTGTPRGPRQLRLRHGQRLGPDFWWAPLHVQDLRAVCRIAGLAVIDLWEGRHRWFCELEMTGHPSGTVQTNGDRARPDGSDIGRERLTPTPETRRRRPR
jgi:SAM-dependent methyltransferase